MRRLTAGFALVAALCAPAAAGASGEPPTSLRDAKPAAPRQSFPLSQDDVLFHAKIALSGGLGWGSKLVGYGSRERYTAASGMMDLEVVNLPWKYAGLELSLNSGYAASGVVSASGNAGRPNYGRLDVAFDAVAIRDPRGALLFGAGLGGDVNERYWFGELRGYPFAVVRGRLVLSRAQALHACWKFAPASLSSRSAMEHRLTLDWSYEMLAIGARFTYARVEGGDPGRAYPDYEAGLSVGVVIW